VNSEQDNMFYGEAQILALEMLRKFGVK